MKNSNWIKKLGLSGWIVLIFFLLSLLPTFSSDFRKVFVDLIAPKDRILLGIVDNKIQGQSGMEQVSKIKTRQGILIEIFGAADQKGSRTLLDKVMIPDLVDGFYHLNSRATNLAITDTDGDGEPEILAPTYDREGRPRLNSIKFNFESKRFLLVE